MPVGEAGATCRGLGGDGLRPDGGDDVRCIQWGGEVAQTPNTHCTEEGGI